MKYILFWYKIKIPASDNLWLLSQIIKVYSKKDTDETILYGRENMALVWQEWKNFALKGEWLFYKQM